MSLALIYLARRKNSGLPAAKAFFDSYTAYETGVKHTLYVVMKGWDIEEEKEQIRSLASTNNAKILELPDDGYDWGAYMRAMPYINEDYVCFLNTHSQITTDNWLKYLYENIQLSKIGLVGCTASYGTVANVAQFIFPLSRNAAQKDGVLNGIYIYLKLLIKFIIFYAADKKFPQFPNPHIRSNAFLIKREHFVEFIKDTPIPKSKRDCYHLENGFKNLTRFIDTKKLTSVVVSTTGQSFKKDQWINSQTFRHPLGQKCLVNDNQTRYYDGLDIYARRLHELTAWGKFLTELKDD